MALLLCLVLQCHAGGVCCLGRHGLAGGQQVRTNAAGQQQPPAAARGAAAVHGRAAALTGLIGCAHSLTMLPVPHPVLVLQKGMHAPSTGKMDDRWRSFMRFQIKRAHQFFEDAKEGVDMLDGKARWPVWSALDLYRQILDAIEANDYDNFSRRAYVPKWKKMASLPLSFSKAALPALHNPEYAGIMAAGANAGAGRNGSSSGSRP